MATENLTIGKHDFEVEVKELYQNDLKFYPKNPRVYSVLNNNGEEPTQEEIEEHMCKLDHVKQLKVSIETNGGLIDALIVRDGDFVVLEGNSRLAAYRLLREKDPIAWGKVKCKVLPKDIDDASIFKLLGQYHIIGRKDWDPFEQANYLYRRQRETKIPIKSMAVELGITASKAEKMVEVIKFMIANNDLNKRHWSYYEEYLKNAGIKKYRETSADLDATIAESIKKEEIREAADLRKLGEIAKVKDNQSKKIMQKIATGKLDIYDGYEEMQESGKLDDVIKKLERFRKEVNESSFEKQIMATPETAQQAKYEIKKIKKTIDSILSKLEK